MEWRDWLHSGSDGSLFSDGAIRVSVYTLPAHQQVGARVQQVAAGVVSDISVRV